MKDYKQFPPIMEGVVDLDIKLSLDYGSKPAPYGTVDFFNKYGYFVIDDLFDFDGSNQQKGLELIEKVLTQKIKLKVKNDSFKQFLFTSKNTSLPKIKSDLVSIYQHYSSSKETPIYIKTKNNEYHQVLLNKGRIIVYENKLDITYCPSFKQKIYNKFKPVNYYFHQLFFSFNLIN